jgi:hypothetical protein
VFSTLKTAAFLYITPYILILTSAIELVPLENLNLSSLSRVSIPAFLGNSGYLSPGFMTSPTVKAAALPKTTKSNKELAPNLLAPCTDAQAASPQLNKPGTTLSDPSLSNVRT